jgi:hypothetical protein
METKLPSLLTTQTLFKKVERSGLKNKLKNELAAGQENFISR